MKYEKGRWVTIMKIQDDYPNRKFISFPEPDETVRKLLKKLYRKMDAERYKIRDRLKSQEKTNLDRNDFVSLQKYFCCLFELTGKTKKQIVDEIGQGIMNCLRSSLKYWSLPSCEIYKKFLNTYGLKDVHGIRKYEELKKEYDGIMKKANPSALVKRCNACGRYVPTEKTRLLKYKKRSKRKYRVCDICSGVKDLKDGTNTISK